MAQRLGIRSPDPPIVGLQYLVDGEEEDLWGPGHPEAGQLRTAALEALSRTDHRKSGVEALGFVARCIGELVEPAKMEVQAKEEWSVAVEGAVKDFGLSGRICG